MQGRSGIASMAQGLVLRMSPCPQGTLKARCSSPIIDRSARNTIHSIAQGRRGFMFIQGLLSFWQGHRREPSVSREI